MEKFTSEDREKVLAMALASMGQEKEIVKDLIQKAITELEMENVKNMSSLTSIRMLKRARKDALVFLNGALAVYESNE